MLLVFDWIPSTYRSLSEKWDAHDPYAACSVSSEQTIPPWSVIAIPELKRFVAKGLIRSGSVEALQKAIEQNPGLKLLELESNDTERRTMVPRRTHSSGVGRFLSAFRVKRKPLTG